jgi:hypothetical protein
VASRDEHAHTYGMQRIQGPGHVKGDPHDEAALERDARGPPAPQHAHEIRLLRQRLPWHKGHQHARGVSQAANDWHGTDSQASVAALSRPSRPASKPRTSCEVGVVHVAEDLLLVHGPAIRADLGLEHLMPAQPHPGSHEQARRLSGRAGGDAP